MTRPGLAVSQYSISTLPAASPCTQTFTARIAVAPTIGPARNWAAKTSEMKTTANATASMEWIKFIGLIVGSEDGSKNNIAYRRANP